MIDVFEYTAPNGWETLSVRVDDDTSSFISISVCFGQEGGDIDLPIEQVHQLVAELQGWLMRANPSR